MKLKLYAISALMAVLPLVACGCSGGKANADGGKARLKMLDDEVFIVHDYGDKGSFVTKTLNLRNFHAINAKTAVWVEYTQGSDYKVVFEGSQKELDELKMEVKDGVLVIDEAHKSTKRYNDNEHFTLYITAPHLDRLNVSGVLNFDAKRVKESKMAMDVSGVFNSDIDLLECDTYEVHNSGVMNCDGKVKSKTANIHTSGVDNGDIAELTGGTEVGVRKAISRARMTVRDAYFKQEKEEMQR